MKKQWIIPALLAVLWGCGAPPVEKTEKAPSAAPVIRVVDTDFSKGRLGLEHQIGLEDVAKMHGHLCDGLVVGFLGLKQALQQLYPDGPVDRTNTRIVSTSAPCLGDVAIYLTGGRYQFHTFYVDDALEGGFYIVQRIDTGEALRVGLKPGVKPRAIAEMGGRAVRRALSPCELDQLKRMEDRFADSLLRADPSEVFVVQPVPDFRWQPVLRNDFLKTDVINKDQPPCTGGR